MEGAHGAAARRRERRLCMFWRHEQLSLKMALAAEEHHSAQPRAAAMGRGEGDAARSSKHGSGAARADP